jgi:putative SOS response-associated peptidase YedK
MCGRFIQYSDPEVYAERFDLELDPELARESRPRYNLAPTQPVLAIRAGTDGRRRLAALRWGLIPSWSKGPDSRYTMINARSDTVASKPAYRSAFRERRCLIPTEGFYEWQVQAGAKQPYLIRRGDRAPFAMAGLWETWMDPATAVAVVSCSIVVTDANPVVCAIHDRMPVVLDPQDYTRWLDPANREIAVLADLLRPAPPAHWTLEPVGRRVNNARQDDPGLIEPLPERPLDSGSGNGFGSGTRPGGTADLQTD